MSFELNPPNPPISQGQRSQCSTRRVCPLPTYFDLPILQRKFNDVLQSLDDALGPQEPSIERLKRQPHLVHTIFDSRQVWYQDEGLGTVSLLLHLNTPKL